MIWVILYRREGKPYVRKFTDDRLARSFARFIERMGGDVQIA